MKYQIYLNPSDQFVLKADGLYIKTCDFVYECLLHIAEIEGVKFEAKFSESYMLDVLTYNHGLQIEVLD